MGDLFTSIPPDLSLAILRDWVQWKQIANLDVAHSNSAFRPFFLALISRPNAIEYLNDDYLDSLEPEERDKLCEADVDVLSRQSDSGPMLSFLHWIHLRQVHLRHVNIRIGHIPDIVRRFHGKTFSSLRRLVVSENGEKLSLSAWTALLAILPELNGIDCLHWSHITDAHLEALLTYSGRLQGLNLAACICLKDPAVVSRVAIHFADSLTDLWCATLNDKALHAIAAKCKQIKTVYLECDSMSAAGLRAFCAAYPHMQELALVNSQHYYDDLDEVDLDDEQEDEGEEDADSEDDEGDGAEGEEQELMEEIGMMGTMEQDVLEAIAQRAQGPHLCNITDDMMKAILQTCRQLTDINLIETTEVTAKVIALVVQHCPKIKSLSIPGLMMQFYPRKTMKVELMRPCDPDSLRAALQVIEMPIEIFSCPNELDFVLDAEIMTILANKFGSQLLDLRIDPEDDPAAFKHLLSSCPLLHTLVLRNCEALTEEIFLKLPLYCPLLHTMEFNRASSLGDKAVIQVLHAYHRLGVQMKSLSFPWSERLADDVLYAIADLFPRLGSLNLQMTLVNSESYDHLRRNGKLVSTKIAGLRKSWRGSIGAHPFTLAADDEEAWDE